MNVKKRQSRKDSKKIQIIEFQENLFQANNSLKNRKSSSKQKAKKDLDLLHIQAQSFIQPQDISSYQQSLLSSSPKNSTQKKIKKAAASKRTSSTKKISARNRREMDSQQQIQNQEMVCKKKNSSSHKEDGESNVEINKRVVKDSQGQNDEIDKQNLIGKHASFPKVIKTEKLTLNLHKQKENPNSEKVNSSVQKNMSSSNLDQNGVPVQSIKQKEQQQSSSQNSYNKVAFDGQSQSKLKRKDCVKSKMVQEEQKIQASSSEDNQIKLARDSQDQDFRNASSFRTDSLQINISDKEIREAKEALATYSQLNKQNSAIRKCTSFLSRSCLNFNRRVPAQNQGFKVNLEAFIQQEQESKKLMQVIFEASSKLEAQNLKRDELAEYLKADIKALSEADKDNKSQAQRDRRSITRLERQNSRDSNQRVSNDNQQERSRNSRHAAASKAKKSFPNVLR